MKSVGKKLPERTCVACHAKKSQRELLRVAAHQGGVAALDASGRLGGRGAYVCRENVCIETAWKRKGLERALKLKSGVQRELKDELLRACE